MKDAKGVLPLTIPFMHAFSTSGHHYFGLCGSSILERASSLNYYDLEYQDLGTRFGAIHLSLYNSVTRQTYSLFPG